jgi:hypothetical protein
VIELELRHREEADDGHGPREEQDLERIGRIAVNRPPDVVEDASDQQRRPGEQTGRQDLEIEPEARLTRVD